MSRKAPKPPIVDTKLYSVKGPNGFRRGSLTKEEAFSLAGRMTSQMKEAGWAGKVEVYYRDGQRVETPETAPS